MKSQPRAFARRKSVTFTALVLGLILPLGVVPLIAAPPPEPAADPAKQPRAREVKAVLGLMLATDDAKRVVVVDVPSNSTTVVGVQKGDLLLSIDGHVVTTIDDVVEYGNKFISAKQPGEEVKLMISRDGKTRTLTAVVPDRTKPAPAPVIVERTRTPVIVEREKDALLCMQLRDLEGGGVVVLRVLDQSPAQKAGIMPNDVIVSVDKFRIRNLVNFNDATKAYVAGQTVTIGLVRANRPLTVTFVLTPCQTVATEIPVARPREPVTRESLDRLSAKLKAMQAQIDELRATADGMAAMIEAMRER